MPRWLRALLDGIEGMNPYGESQRTLRKAGILPPNLMFPAEAILTAMRL